jgi:hypothetical protein
LLHVHILLILLFWSSPPYFSSLSLLIHPLSSLISYPYSSFSLLVFPFQTPFYLLFLIHLSVCISSMFVFPLF